MVPPLITLEHPAVRLIPFDESHMDAALAAAEDESLWRWWPRDMRTPQSRRVSFEALLDLQAQGAWHARSVIAPDGAYLGQTCYLAIRPEHRGLEIGHTWYVRAAHGTMVNPAAKLLMLGHAFAHGMERVELKTDALNARSRAAISKLGAQFEGVFRRHLLMPDGRWRDTAWFSVIAQEWPAVEAGLRARLAEAGA
jgi:N-acetyltransferase